MEMEKWIDGKQNNHFLQNVSTAIRWHQTMRHEKMEQKRERVQEGEIMGEKEQQKKRPHIPPPCPLVPYGPCTLLCCDSDEKQATIPFNLASVPQSC